MQDSVDFNTAHPDDSEYAFSKPQPLFDLLQTSDQDRSAGARTPAPIEKLPTELTQRVFLFTLPLLPYPYLPNILTEFEESDDDVQHINVARLCLTHVCRTWRTIAHFTTYLWTTIAIDRPFPKDFTVVEEWFANAGTRSLDISFDPHIFMQHPLKLTTLLRQVMGRIRCLVTLHGIMNTSILQELFPPGIIIEAPVMEALRLHCGESHAPIGRINAPSLVYFHQDAAANTYAYLNPTPSLRSYAGSGTSLSFVVQCSRITELEVHLHRHILPNGIGPVVLETVQSLCLIPYLGTPNSSILHFVQQIDVPSLTTLEVWMNNSWHDTVTCGHLLGIIAERYGGNLQHLEVGCAEFEGRSVVKDTFLKMPHLRTLTFASSILAGVYNALMPNPSPASPLSSWPCPELSKLRIINSTVTPDSIFNDLIRQRAVSNRTFGHPTIPIIEKV